jgi:hypothetical protein
MPLAAKGRANDVDHVLKKGQANEVNNVPKKQALHCCILMMVHIVVTHRAARAGWQATTPAAGTHLYAVPRKARQGAVQQLPAKGQP